MSTNVPFAASKNFVVEIIQNGNGKPSRRARGRGVELHSWDPAGLKLIGFAIWERRSGAGHSVTSPARQYAVNGGRRSFALLRPVVDASGQEAVRDLVLPAYTAHEGMGRERSAAAGAPAALRRLTAWNVDPSLRARHQQ